MLLAILGNTDTSPQDLLSSHSNSKDTKLNSQMSLMKCILLKTFQKMPKCSLFH